MCTVTFIAQPTGYQLAMNRDEQRTRIRGLPPKRHWVQGHHVIHPSEPGGGTWIALNDTGTALALINWYAARPGRERNLVSRGTIVAALRAVTSVKAAQCGLAQLPLSRMNPFRLIGVFPAAERGRIVEWRWDRESLAVKPHRWQPQQWSSSGYDEPGAQRTRARIFRQAMSQRSARTLAWLRRLHRSHQPERGAYSICMHRPDAATVSYTEIVARKSELAMRYLPGPPCEVARLKQVKLSLHQAGQAP